MWVYADGRLILSRFHYLPEDASDAFIGLVEQRLTPGGVEFLRSAIISTGLFGSDLALAREGKAPYLEIQVRNGDRLVRVTWAWRGITGDAPIATQEQESALRALNALLTDPASWPASAWLDQANNEYVPSEYSICFRVFTYPEPTEPIEPIEPARIWGLLPQPAQDLLRAGDPTQESGAMSPNCSRVTTDDARALARILDVPGILRARPERGAYWLRFLVFDPSAPGSTIWISFEPVLPHGEATWLGPG
jgi:hypothetical protein